MSPEDKFKAILELLDPYYSWWDEVDDWNEENNQHHETCEMARSINPTEDREFYTYGFDTEEGETWELNKAAIAAKCECWLGAVWRIRELAKA